MNQEMDLPVDRRPSPPAARMGGSAAEPSPDVARMLQDFERRIATLEARLDESNEAREKLKRQVAAQSEELRVQRAAIARTQRALRTMTPGDEDKATERALRDGDTQAKTRVTPYGHRTRGRARVRRAHPRIGRRRGTGRATEKGPDRLRGSPSRAGLARSVDPPNAINSTSVSRVGKPKKLARSRRRTR